MTLTLHHNDDIELVSNAVTDNPVWDSTGDDPAFTIKFGFIRLPYIVIRLHSMDGETLDPRVYINRGQGFRELDSVELPKAKNLVITADVGRVGTVCAVRVDPCSRPGRLDFDVKCFSTRREAEAFTATVAAEHPSSESVSLSQLPRFWFNFPKIASGKKPLVRRYADASYSLAKDLRPAPYDSDTPWLSIVVPVYNAPVRYLDDLLRSFLSQDQTGAELVLSDDGSTSAGTREWLLSNSSRENVTIILNEKNEGIAGATNSGLRRCSGDWIGFLDHDDLIAPHALKMIRLALERHPEAKFLYTDELVVDDELVPTGTMLKPAYDPVLLTGVNYMNHFSIYRRKGIEELGFLRAGFDGSQDYDLLLRYLERCEDNEVLHLPYPAYWWRRTGATYSRTFIQKATYHARQAIREAFERQGDAVRVEEAITSTLHRPEFSIEESDWPKVSIIIPSKDGLDLISRILDDIFHRTDYPNFEVIVVDNGSTTPEVHALYDRMRQEHTNFTAIVNSEQFNFARSVNRGVKAGGGRHFLILNNDVEVIDHHWLKEMVACLKFRGTGIVGAKLLFGNGAIQHAGVIVGFGGLAGHWYLNRPRDFGGPMNRLHVRSSLTCVTGAVMLISGECLKAVGLWDEQNFAVAYNDVDYCLRARKAGFRIIWTPFACLYHHESLSRGAEKGKEKKKRFEAEKANLRRIHNTTDFLDPAHNPNLTRDRSTPHVTVPRELRIERTGAVS